MIVWVDAQLSPAIATWLSRTQGVEAVAVRDLGLRDAEDEKIFTAARDAAAVLMTKDQDFVQLLDRLGPPPQVIWITCGNTSNAALKDILATAFPTALAMLGDGESLVEIREAPA